MIKKYYSEHENVVSAARKRIMNIFRTANQVVFSTSGGKDSICLNDLIFKLCQSGKIDKQKLIVQFIDEEAIYPCVEKTVKNMRIQWISIGVKFEWYCVQVKHYCCLNMLTNDDSFICWDETKKDVWIRQKPDFAISSDPLLKERKETYQDFLKRKNKKRVVLTGVRVSESIHRRYNIARRKDEGMMFPIYDWTDTDVWNYISDNNLDFPKAYMYMYQVGVANNRLRISQFFSIDTIASLVNMCQYYPGLFDKICNREPNAYMAMLYFDTEMFRRKKKRTQSEDEEKPKDKFYRLYNEMWRYETAQEKKNRKNVSYILLRFGNFLNDKEYKQLSQVLEAGDPKGRAIRAINMHLFKKVGRLGDGKY